MNIPVITPLFGAIIKFIYDLFGQNYMLALVIFAVLVKLILFPFGIKQQKNTLKQAKMRPMETAIRRKYAGRNDRATQQKMQEEIMALYQQEGYNPASGCLPLLIQMPVLFGLYSVIVNPLRYISGLTTEVVNKLSGIFGAVNYDIDVINALDKMGSSIAPVVKNQVSSADLETIAKVKDSFSVFGIDLSTQPSVAFNIYIIIPILTFVFAFFSTKIIRKFTYQPQQTDEMARSMGMMDWTMPLLSVWISFSVPAAIAIYWIIQNILSALQQIVLYKMYPVPVCTEEEIKAAELQLKGKASKNNQNSNNNRNLPDPDYNSPIYEEVPEVDFKDNDTSDFAVNKRPTGLTPAIKKHLKQTGKPLKARRRI